MNYLRPMGKLWCAKAATMLKSMPKILLLREMQPDKTYHRTRALSLKAGYKKKTKVFFISHYFLTFARIKTKITNLGT